MEIVHFCMSLRTEHVGMVTKPTNTHKYIEVFCITNIVLLHVSATLVAVLREVHNKQWIYLDTTKVCGLMNGCQILSFDFKT